MAITRVVGQPCPVGQEKLVHHR